MKAAQLQDLAAEHGTPLLVIDHDVIRRSFREFRQHLPRVQAYYAVKANPSPEIIRTLYGLGAGFDVASLPEFSAVLAHVRHLDPDAQQQFCRERIIHANPIRSTDTLRALDQHEPLLTLDNAGELERIAQYAPRARVLIRLRVPNTGSQCELSSKFGCEPGDALRLVQHAAALGLAVSGVSFHVGSQCTDVDNFVQALGIARAVMDQGRDHGHDLELLDIGGGFPAPDGREVRPFGELARVLAAELDRLFPPPVRIIAEPGRFLVAAAAVAVASVIGRAQRDGKTCYYIDDSVYHTFSGIIFDHAQYRIQSFRAGAPAVCAVFGRTCDGLDAISLGELLPELAIGDLVYARNIGAYSSASATWFNGFAPAQVVHVNGPGLPLATTPAPQPVHAGGAA